MDNSGRWHASEAEAVDANRRIREQFSGIASNMPERPAISIEIGEIIAVVKLDGSRLMASFDAAEKNKVTLDPQPDAHAPYFELAEHVTLERATGESVRAQVWDNRKGKLILRTLPV
jgi:hypothetical protein